MLFIEFRFFLFFALVFGVYWTLRRNAWRKAWILLCSHFFYACFFVGDPFRFLGNILDGEWEKAPAGWWFPLVLLGSTCMDYVVGLGIAGARTQAARKGWLLLSLVANLGTLGFFKYFNFFLTSASEFLAWLGLPASDWTLRIILPYGVSFYTFQSLSYSIEVYRGHIKAERSFLDLAFFIAFFPQLVAGPIVRAMSFLPQTKTLRRWESVDVRGALVQFLVGFVKKACIAESVAPFVDEYFAAPEKYDAVSAWIAVALYAVQIYCDFSGYTDMAIAAARLIGYELTVNFNFPYFARSMTDFWRRWHISLSSWLRDYLYISLGGNRGSQWFTHRNLFLTMLLGGLWHGAAWTFVIWGALHGAALIVHREWQRWRGTDRRRPRVEPSPQIPGEVQVANPPAPAISRGSGVVSDAGRESSAVIQSAGERETERDRASSAGAVPVWRERLGTAAAIAATFYFVCICWIFFRMPDLEKAWLTCEAFLFLQADGRAMLDRSLWLLFGGLALMHWLNYRRVFSTWWRRGPDALFAVGYGATAAVVLLFVPQKYTPFIYFQF